MSSSSTCFILAISPSCLAINTIPTLVTTVNCVGVMGKGIALQFKQAYVKHLYGPYAHHLNQVLKHIEGHYIRGYGDGTSKAESAEIYVLPEGREAAQAFLEIEPDAQERKLFKPEHIRKAWQRLHEQNWLNIKEQITS